MDLNEAERNLDKAKLTVKALTHHEEESIASVAQILYLQIGTFREDTSLWDAQSTLLDTRIDEYVASYDEYDKESKEWYTFLKEVMGYIHTIVKVKRIFKHYG